MHHGSAALVALSGACGEKSAPGERRIPRIDGRIRCLRGGSWPGERASNEFGGPENLLDGDCWKYWLLYGDMQKEHAQNLMLRSDDD